MKAHTYLIPFSILLFSCNGGNNSNTKATENKDSSAIQNITGTKSSTKISNHVLLSNIKTHCFSDNEKKDTFKLILTGDSLYTATVIFSIISYKGVMIYVDTFHGYDLFKNDDTLVPSISKIELAMKEKVHTFFQDKQFSEPADADSTDNGEGSDSDRATLDIASDKTAIGFTYSFGEENVESIAYSKKQHKVLVYWSCC